MSASGPLDVVRGYDEAFDARDVDRMVALARDDCEVVTMHRGILRGHDVLRTFMARQTYGVTPVVKERRYFSRGDTVVSFMRAEWRYVETGEAAGEDEGAVVHTVVDGRIARLEIKPDLESALACAGLTEHDAVPDV